MKHALKLQADLGGPDAFDATGGEPVGTHRTAAELDPCPQYLMDVLDGTLQDAIDNANIDPSEKVGDVLNSVLKRLGLSIDLPGLGSAHMILRKMDSDGHA